MHDRKVAPNAAEYCGQDWKQEIVAELSAAVLCHLVGKTSMYLGNNYKYVATYAKEANLTPVQGCLKVM